jgi:hypothetical protein
MIFNAARFSKPAALPGGCRCGRRRGTFARGTVRWRDLSESILSEGFLYDALATGPLYAGPPNLCLLSNPRCDPLTSQAQVGTRASLHLPTVEQEEKFVGWSGETYVPPNTLLLVHMPRRTLRAAHPRTDI